MNLPLTEVIDTILRSVGRFDHLPDEVHAHKASTRIDLDGITTSPDLGGSAFIAGMLMRSIARDADGRRVRFGGAVLDGDLCRVEFSFEDENQAG